MLELMLWIWQPYRGIKLRSRLNMVVRQSYRIRIVKRGSKTEHMVDVINKTRIDLALYNDKPYKI